LEAGDEPAVLVKFDVMPVYELLSVGGSLLIGGAINVLHAGDLVRRVAPYNTVGAHVSLRALKKPIA
jgi:hypothetical protein